MLLSVIIVNFNSAHVLIPCLRSIETHLANHTHEVCVVDNASADGSASIARQLFPHVNVISHTQNRGFAAGINTGLRNTRGQYVLWLNPDSELLNEGIADLIQYMAGHPEIGIVGPQIVNHDRSIQLSCRSFPSYSTALFHRYSL